MLRHDVSLCFVLWSNQAYGPLRGRSRKKTYAPALKHCCCRCVPEGGVVGETGIN
ncbi:hypothetical protein NY78_1350 [Desulfovibrio sp. TomC]|nr:hypothetical protein NY78_1350 [Desulfovibrio sp. TomC]